MTTTPTVFIVDDDPAVRDSLEMLIRTQGMSVRAYPSATHFLKDFLPEAIGCLVLDIRMPQITGLALQEMLQSKNMHLPIVFITGHGDVEQCSRAFRNGAIDFLTKPIDQGRLLDGIRRGIRMCIQQHQQESENQDVMQRLSRLSAREREVLDLIADGMSSKEIAARLGLSPRTVDVYRANLFDKLEVPSLADLVRFYLRALEATGKKPTEI
jgi:FixJ family two-component response regulator